MKLHGRQVLSAVFSIHFNRLTKLALAVQSPYFTYCINTDSNLVAVTKTDNHKSDQKKLLRGHPKPCDGSF